MSMFIVEMMMLVKVSIERMDIVIKSKRSLWFGIDESMMKSLCAR